MRWQLWLLLVLCLAVGAGISEWLGQDANYDLQAYHLYNGAALLQGRFARDLVPAGMQSYFNPLLDALYAGLALGPLLNWPRLLAAVMGLWYGGALFLTARIADCLYPGRIALALAAAILGVTGVGMVSQIGTSFDEVQIAVFMLAGLLALLQPGAPRWSAPLAGVLFGMAAGLKLTACVFAAPALLAAWSVQPKLRTPLHFAGCWLAGFAVTDGWWAVMLFERFGSPTFPLFNGVFRSEWYPPASFVDDRFLPGSLLRALIYPFLWLTGPATLVSEIPVRDPRGAVALCLGVVAILAGLIGKRDKLSPGAQAMLLFLVTGYALWVGTSGILRYAVVLEVACGLVIPLLVATLLPRRIASAAVTILLAGILLATRYGSWGRIPYGPHALQADLEWVQPDTLVIVEAWAMLSNFVPLLPHQHQIRVMGLDFAVLDARGWRLHDEALRMVEAQTGPIQVLTYATAGKPAYELGEIGLDSALTECRPISSVYVTSGELGPFACVAHHRAVPVLPSQFWAQAASRYRTLVQPRDAAMTLFGATYLASAGPAARGTRIFDWGDLLWRGVRPQADVLKRPIDRGAIYILSPDLASAMAGRVDPAHDALGVVDGITVLAPGWRDCAVCTVQPAPLAR